MTILLIILIILCILSLWAVLAFCIYLFRWMKRRDEAQANLLRRMMEQRQESASIRAMKHKG